MTSHASHDVIVVGAGPVGLFMAVSLAQLGVDVCLLERRLGPRMDARTVGIHPRALALFGDLGVAPAIVAEGVAVRRGLAFSEQRVVGELRFDALRSDYRYVLSIPQHRIETVLRRRLDQLAPDAFVPGAEVYALRQTADSVVVAYGHEGEEKIARARVVIGCDGVHSVVRAQAGIDFRGHSYGGRFIMGDYRDDTAFRGAASLYLTSRGLVSSFPLPGRIRRWVLAADPRIGPLGPEQLADEIERRTRLDIDPRGCSMLAVFTPERYLADNFASGGIAIAGEAAHVLSPLGGQGTNLGFLDAARLTGAIFEAGGQPDAIEPLLARYSVERRRRALAAMRRAELGLWLGQSRATGDLRRVVLSRALRGSVGEVVSRLYAGRTP